jgi:ATP-dependent exoDNAse (exonuclease V) beta subunit
MDAIRIMTIHKSKGLGFNVVIIPFLYESLDHQPLLSPNLWCSYKGWPVPVKYSKGLLDTEFADMYLNEKLCAYVDAMNTVYVAFTRPKRELVVFAPEPVMKKNGPSRSSMSDILYAYCSTHHKGDGEWQGKTLIGEHSAVSGGSAPAQKLVLDNVFAAPLNENRMRMAATSGTIGDGESIREHGIAMHYVFSLIDYPESIPGAVAKACREGVASCGEKELLAMVNAKVESVAGYGWFNSGWTVINECTILTKWGEERRPDRVIIKGDEAVVIDYKFGTAHKENPQLGEKYKKQVSRYMELLTRMGYKNVKGYLWYLTSDEVICI